MTARRTTAVALIACTLASHVVACASGGQEHGPATVSDAARLADAGNLDGALALLRQIIAGGPISARLDAMLAAARLHAQLGQSVDAEQLYRELLETDSQAQASTEELAAARCELAALYRRRDEWTAASELWRQVVDGRSAASPTILHCEAAYWLAYADYRGGRHDAARQRLTDLSGRLGEMSTPAAGATDDAAAGDATVVARVRELQQYAAYLLSQAEIADENWTAAAVALDELRAASPGDPLLAQAEFWRAEIAYRHGDDELARELFAQVALRTAGLDEDWTALAPLRLAQLEAARQRWNEALLALDWLAWRRPEFPLAFEADYLRGRALAGRGEFTAARTAYCRVLDRPAAVGTETAAMAQWMIGETFFHQRAYAEARTAYQKVIDQHARPEWQARAALQLGKCWELDGRWQNAAAVYADASQRFATTDSGPTLVARRRFVDRQLAALR